MSGETLLSTLSNVLRAQDIYTSVLRYQSFTSRAEKILQSIESIQTQTIDLSELEKSEIESIYFDIKNELNNGQNINLQSLNNAIKKYNDIATSIWKVLNN